MFRPAAGQWHPGQVQSGPQSQSSHFIFVVVIAISVFAKPSAACYSEDARTLPSLHPRHSAIRKSGPPFPQAPIDTPDTLKLRALYGVVRLAAGPHPGRPVRSAAPIFDIRQPKRRSESLQVTDSGNFAKQALWNEDFAKPSQQNQDFRTFRYSSRTMEARMRWSSLGNSRSI